MLKSSCFSRCRPYICRVLRRRHSVRRTNRIAGMPAAPSKVKNRVVEEVQVLSTHPLLTRAVERILGRVKDVSVRGLPPAANETEALNFSSDPRLFLLDSCSLRSDVGPIAARCRANLPGSRFLALLPPESPIAEQIRLFYWGIDGFLELGRTWQAELPKAIERLVR